jgi:hypothetical protein
MLDQELPDLAPAMNRPAVPEQVDRSAEVTQEVTEEGLDIEAGEIVGATPEVESHSPSPGRYRQAAADRQPVVPVAVPDARCLSLGRPGAVDIRDQQEPALIDEDEVGAASSGVFLSAAIRSASTERWRARRARPRGARASGSSSPGPSAPSRHGRGDSTPRTRAESTWRPAAASTDRSGARRAVGPESTAAQADASAPGIGAAGDPASAWRSVPWCPSDDTLAASETPNSRRRQSAGRPPRASARTPTTEPRGAVASPVPWAFQKVA